MNTLKLKQRSSYPGQTRNRERLFDALAQLLQADPDLGRPPVGGKSLKSAAAKAGSSSCEPDPSAPALNVRNQDAYFKDSADSQEDAP